jgi:hypothetical protein
MSWKECNRMDERLKFVALEWRSKWVWACSILIDPSTINRLVPQL